MADDPVVTPAFRWARSTMPSHSSITRSQSAGDETSASMKRAPMSGGAARSTMTTPAPEDASNRAVARPMPDAPPVTTATLPSSAAITR